MPMYIHRVDVCCVCASVFVCLYGMCICVSVLNARFVIGTTTMYL